MRVWRALNTARRCKRSWTIWKSTTATLRCRSKGYRFVDYLLALRIRKAQWLLVNGVPPQQVPERVGYSANPQYFVHLFSKATGMTPREYAQALRIEP